MDEYHKKLLEELPSLGHWHHAIDLGEGISTNQKKTAVYNPEDRWKLIEPYFPKDLTGKTVLDLGCNSGYFSVQMKKRGASRVVSVDSFEGAIKQTKFLSKWFGVDLEVIHEEAHVYCLTTDERFDYVLYLGLFYHLKYPVLVLDRLAEMAKSKLFFQTIFVQPDPNFNPKENYSVEEMNKTINTLSFPRMMFLEKKFNNNLSTWWVSNQAAVVSLLRSAKLKIIATLEKGVYVCEPDNPYGKKVYSKLVFPKHGKYDWHLPK